MCKVVPSAQCYGSVCAHSFEILYKSGVRTGLWQTVGAVGGASFGVA